MPILKIEHLTKTYGRKGTSLTALDDINLTVENGEFVVIIGSSGKWQIDTLALPRRSG